MFVAVSDEDLAIIGHKWQYTDNLYGECIKAKWEWTAAEEKGKKYSWNPETNDWTAGGMGGWDTLISSRIPSPLRVRPSDDATTTESQIKDILTAAVKAGLKTDGSRAAGLLSELKKLSDKLTKDVEKELAETTEKIEDRLAAVFPGYGVEFTPEIGKFEPEKAIGADSYISITGPNNDSNPLSRQGAGLRRTFLWAALGVLADVGRAKVGKKKLDKDKQRILLIEEPEAFLHPPMIRSAREALYNLSAAAEWQVLATTHSPLFIDVSKPHTTIVRIARDGPKRTRLFSTDRANFSDTDRDNLRMIRSCHPTVAEFFFADHVLLVEGETEQAVLSTLFDHAGSPTEHLAIVNCMGKANLPMFQRILNQFGSSYTAVHDCDAPRVQRNGTWQKNSMWTINEKIVEAINQREETLPAAYLVAHVPDFEGYYFKTNLTKDKPYRAHQIIRDPEFAQDDKYLPLREAPEQLIKGTHAGRYSTMEELETQLFNWTATTKPETPEKWQVMHEEA